MLKGSVNLKGFLRLLLTSGAFNFVRSTFSLALLLEGVRFPCYRFDGGELKKSELLQNRNVYLISRPKNVNLQTLNITIF